MFDSSKVKVPYHNLTAVEVLTTDKGSIVGFCLNEAIAKL